jgi:hypothetical protein
MSFCRIILISAVAVLLTLSGCAQTFDGLPHKHPACGHWEWVSSGGGISGQQNSDPETTGHTKSLTLHSTGEFEKFRDGELATMGVYSIEFVETANGGKEMIRFRSESGQEWSRVLVGVNSFELHLHSGASDGTGSTYVRVY